MKDGVCWFGGGVGCRLGGLSEYWEGGVIWLWCEWERDWRRGCGEIRGGRSGWVKEWGRWCWLSSPR